MAEITMRRFRRTLKWTAVVIAVYAIAGFLVLPPIIKSVLVKKLSESLHREVTVRGISVNPFMLSLAVKGVEIKRREGPGTFVSFDELYINLQSLSLVKKGIILNEVRLKRPYVNLVRNEDLTYNFSDLMEKKGPKTEPMRYSLNNIQVSGGGADFYDGPEKTRHKLTDINVTVPFLSNLDYYSDIFVQPSFSANVNGAHVTFHGEAKPFSDSLETRFDINLKDFNIPYHLAYVPFKMRFKMPSGFLDTDVDVSYMQYKDGRRPTLNVSGDIALKKFVVTDESGRPVVDIPRLDVSITSAEVMSRAITLSRVAFDSPRLDVVRNGRGEVNLLSLLPEKSGGPPEQQASSPLSIDVNYLRVKTGTVSFEDGLAGRGFKALLKPVNLTVVNFNNVKGWKTSVGLDMRTDAGESVKFDGEVALDPLMTAGSLDLRNIPLKRYSPYYRDAVLFDVMDGKLDLSTGFRYSASKDAPEARVFGLSASLGSLRLKKRDEKTDFLVVPELAVKDTSVDLVNRELTLGGLYTRKGYIGLRRFKDGNLNVMRLVKPAGGERKKPVKPRDAEKGWAVTLHSVEADSWTLRMEDMWPPQPATLTAEKLNFKAGDISTVKGSVGRMEITFKPNGKGDFSAKGALGVNPLSVSVNFGLKDVEAASMQPYFADRIKMTVTEGKVAADGKVSLGYSPSKGFHLKYDGDVSLYKFASVDKQGSEDFIKWKALSLGGMGVGYNPNYVNIKAVSISDFYSRIVLNPDGTLNVMNVLGQGPAAGGEAQAVQASQPPKPPRTPAAAPVTGMQAWPVRVDKITLQGGRVEFKDRKVTPSYSAALTEIGGRVTGLSSEEIRMADVDLRGNYDNSAPIEITGKVNPLRQDLYIDLKVRFADMDLSTVSPYAGKYLGYKIEKGKLSFDLKYLIVRKKLDSENNIFIDQLTLGDRVESPDATKLPVKLAIALLRDRNGEIHLDVPVTGRTDDPKFDIWGIVFKVIWNVIVKAVTSPFALLGSIFGGGEELGYVEFAPGSYALDPVDAKKLDTLAKALYDRPSLKLSIEGHVDTEKDREGLKEYIFNKKLKARKLSDMLDEGLPPVPVDEVKINPDEYEKYLRMAYKAEKFPKPRNILGFAKKLPPAEMEKLMLTNIEVREDDLRQLASERAEKVKDYMLGPGKVEPARVFLVEPKSLSPEKKEGEKDSRVDFILE